MFALAPALFILSWQLNVQKRKSNSGACARALCVVLCFYIFFFFDYLALGFLFFFGKKYLYKYVLSVNNPMRRRPPQRKSRKPHLLQISKQICLLEKNLPSNFLMTLFKMCLYMCVCVCCLHVCFLSISERFQLLMPHCAREFIHLAIRNATVSF